MRECKSCEGTGFGEDVNSKCADCGSCRRCGSEYWPHDCFRCGPKGHKGEQGIPKKRFFGDIMADFSERMSWEKFWEEHPINDSYI